MDEALLPLPLTVTPSILTLILNPNITLIPSSNPCPLPHLRPGPGITSSRDMPSPPCHPYRPGPGITSSRDMPSPPCHPHRPGPGITSSRDPQSLALTLTADCRPAYTLHPNSTPHRINTPNLA